jgi:hypothetical protein
LCKHTTYIILYLILYVKGKFKKYELK